MEKKTIHTIIEKMIPHYHKYNQALINIASYFNENSVPPKELPKHDYKWNIQKDEDNRT